MVLLGTNGRERLLPTFLDVDYEAQLSLKGSAVHDCVVPPHVATARVPMLMDRSTHEYDVEGVYPQKYALH